ncbi:glycogen/starch/alpha-glucan phosphorylase [Ectothiorhodospiraceae bacterium BW-2]|nr:glycogen/starch/alpha-glucan phosphorylase [Ectothiorhodospiraceae bacterium BW-2]
MAKQSEVPHEHTRTGMSVDALKRAFNDNLFYLQGRFYDVASIHDQYMAAAYTVRDRLLERWIKTAQIYKNKRARTVCYLSAEYLPGPHLLNNLINLGIVENARKAGDELGLDFDAIIEQEEEPGLGNGGLGRLAACYMDSLATLQIPAIGYGIRYEYGIFDQAIENGWQSEVTDHWLRNGNPWELRRAKLRFPVRFGGSVSARTDENGRLKIDWNAAEVVNGVAYDTPILGYGVDNVNLLRLWKSEACESFDFQAFNTGNYYEAVNSQVTAENLSKVLYPNDEPEIGKELRLKQQYFFVSCSLQDMVRLQRQTTGSLEQFHHKFAAQLNDTHPAIAIPELMRILLDEHNMDWKLAWDITRNTFAYTNHTLLPEALESWPVDLLERILPRHMAIIYEINSRFLDKIRYRYLDDVDRIGRLSLINEQGRRSVRMAHLACVGSYAINGVANLHSELLKSTVLKDFYELWPEKFSNKTNGVTPRRFMVLSNPRLADLLNQTIGSGWIRDLNQLRQLESYAEEEPFRQQWRETKLAAKQHLAHVIIERTGIRVDPTALFDVQCKRIHEYKRQHLNVLHIIALYEQLKQNPHLDIPARTFVFGGKAAPGYFMAKLIIKFINAVGEMINGDRTINDRIKVVFFPDFNVQNAQHIYPAADLSEQISTAGLEASGTGNMKFSMNGALTIGTLDGANIEIREEVGADNFFLFGHTEQELRQWRNSGYYPEEQYRQNEHLRSAIDLVRSGFFSRGNSQLFQPIVDNLLYDDRFMLLADFQSYFEVQQHVSNAFMDRAHWDRMSILNVARIGKFSSDRAIQQYCDEIWHVEPCAVERLDKIKQ